MLINCQLEAGWLVGASVSNEWFIWKLMSGQKKCKHCCFCLYLLTQQFDWGIVSQDTSRLLFFTHFNAMPLTKSGEQFEKKVPLSYKVVKYCLIINKGWAFTRYYPLLKPRPSFSPISHTQCCNAQPVTKVCLQCFTEIFQQMLPLFSLHISKNDADRCFCLSASAGFLGLFYLTIIQLCKISKIRIVFRESLTE